MEDELLEAPLEEALTEEELEPLSIELPPEEEYDPLDDINT